MTRKRSADETGPLVLVLDPRVAKKQNRPDLSVSFGTYTQAKADAWQPAMSEVVAGPFRTRRAATRFRNALAARIYEE